MPIAPDHLTPRTPQASGALTRNGGARPWYVYVMGHIDDRRTSPAVRTHDNVAVNHNTQSPPPRPFGR